MKFVFLLKRFAMAMQADKELTSNGKSPEKLKAAGSLLMKVFGVLAVKVYTRFWFLYCRYKC
ncbi:hypothetical protein N665_0567s0011 [Sinapis alba]|nr:hypothetical protein N665_0567s0011 [Sinapis alba]